MCVCFLFGSVRTCSLFLAMYADPDSEFFWPAKTQNSKFGCKSGFVVVVVVFLVVVVGCLFVVFHCCAVQTDRQTNEDAALIHKTE